MDAKQKIEAALKGKWGWLPTDGPWFARFNGVSASESRDEGDWVARSMGTRGKTELEEINNIYIAAVNPANIRELLQTLASKDDEIARLRGHLEITIACIHPTASEFARMAANKAKAYLKATTPQPTE